MRLKLLLLKRSVVVEDNHTSSTISKHSDATYIDKKLRKEERKEERKQKRKQKRKEKTKRYFGEINR